MTAPAGGRGRPGRRLLGFGTAALAALALVTTAYSNHFGNAFHFDDAHVIVENQAIRSLDGWPRFFTDALTYSARPQNASYRPLLTLSYALDYRAGGGLDPRAFHRTQFGLLLLLGVALVALYEKLGENALPGTPTARWLALFAATLFCVHTANTQTVNYLSSRSSLVATMGIVGGMVLWTAWPRGRRTGLYLVPVILGGLAKPEAVMFAPILALWVLLFEEGISLTDAVGPRGRTALGRTVFRTLPAFAVCGALYILARAMESASMVYSDLDRWVYARSQPFVWLHYLRLFFWPVGLTADTDWRPIDDWWDWRLATGAVFVGALVVAIVALSRVRRLRPAAFGLGWFGLGLLPTSSVFPLSEMYNEHRLFLPFVGLTFAAVWSVAAIFRWRLPDRWPGRAAIVGLAIAILVAHGVGTYSRNRIWRDDLTLWSDVVQKSPDQARGSMNFGLALLGRGRTEEALERFREAHRLAPDYAFLETNLGVALSALGRHEEARGHFERALALDPTHAEGRAQYAAWLVKTGQGPAAVAQLEQALRLAPHNAGARTLLMRLLAASGAAARLEALAQDTLALDPLDRTALTLTGVLDHDGVAEHTAAGYERAGRRQIDLEQWIDGAVLTRRAIALDDGTALAWNQLGWAQARLGFWTEAVESFRQAVERDPGMELARSNLAWARARELEGGAGGQEP